MDTPHAGDLERLLAMRHDNGGDFWAPPDGRIGIERPISTLTALLVLAELEQLLAHRFNDGG